ncbi:hypothetical protein [Tardiphaga sp. 862_B3_N1_1]|uniref:hypothetical protein n=1 Tax=Tardiphaga sp. 862_B3_N1_1 TaxID=3240763 RepID=UPI003F895586
MTELEQLELVAKAVGRNLADHQPVLARDGVSYLPPPAGLWNPRTDFRDAMEVAFKMGMKVDFHAWLTVSHPRLKSGGITSTGHRPKLEDICSLVMYIAVQVAQLPPLSEPKPIKMSDLAALDASLSEVLFRSPPPGQQCNRMMDRQQWMAEGAAVEREACAQLCEAQHEEDRPGDYAYAIRARGAS